MKNKRRRDYVKPLRRLSLFSFLILIGCLLIGLLSGDIAGVGFFSLLIGFGGFIALQAYQYNTMRKCRCRNCGHVEVFETKGTVVIDVRKRCPKCNSKFKENEVVE